jgi:NAD(P)-dependent dehydrogenase (short-subunit alcohol dehydrogenase family)
MIMGTHWTTADMPPLAGKLALVTGANSGLGLDTTIGLASHGARVVMACRDAEKARVAAGTVRAKVPAAAIDVMTLDLADLDSIHRFAQAFFTQFPRLDILVNNAGVMALPLRRTRQGFEMQIGTNHLGHFALTGLLLDRLRAAPQARVVSLASQAHRITAGMDLDDLNWEHKPYKKWDAYGKSKLANLLFTFELGRRLRARATNVIAVAAHPGFAATNLQTAGPDMEGSKFGRRFMEIGNVIFAQPAHMGALPSLYACSAADIANGDYIGPDGFQQMRGHPRKVDCSKAAKNPQTAATLWTLSEQLTEVSYLSQ